MKKAFMALPILAIIIAKKNNKLSNTRGSVAFFMPFFNKKKQAKEENKCNMYKIVQHSMTSFGI